MSRGSRSCAENMMFSLTVKVPVTRSSYNKLCVCIHTNVYSQVIHVARLELKVQPKPKQWRT